MYLEETETTNICAEEGLQQFNRPTDKQTEADWLENLENLGHAICSCETVQSARSV